MPDSDLGREGGCWCQGRGRREREREEVSVGSGDIYVRAGSVVQCSHQTARGTGGTGRVIIVTLLNISARELNCALCYYGNYSPDKPRQVLQLEN